MLTGWQVVLGAVPIALGAAVPVRERRRPAAPCLAARLPVVGRAARHGLRDAGRRDLLSLGMVPARGDPAGRRSPSIGTLGIPIVGLFTSALVLGEPVGNRGARGPDARSWAVSAVLIGEV